ncbi:hypothetical protein HY631_03405 [Candidatus Uhrbacteria bacterium]|nr:hypothetical protein [Candidatus Uhrbacteria bacterium]
MSERLGQARAALSVAQAEFNVAFNAQGFNPARAEKAQARLEAAKAELQNALVSEAGEVSRERALSKLHLQLEGAERALRFSENNFRRALREVGGLAPDNPIEHNARRLKELREHDGAMFAKASLKPAQRENVRVSLAYVAEAEYRLDFVLDKTHEVARLKQAIKELEHPVGQAVAK